MPEWTVYLPFVIPRLQISPERKIGLITGGEDSAGVDHSDDGDDPDDACRQPKFERFATDAHGMPACHFADTTACPKENQPTKAVDSAILVGKCCASALGHELPRRLAERAAAMPPKAAAPSRDQGGRGGPQTDIGPNLTSQGLCP